MTIDFFSEFLTLAETQNFGTTAERHYMSIATLSRHMRSLEEQFGTILFRRHGNKFILTDAGKMLIPYAQTIVTARDSYREAVAPFRDRPHLNISVASTAPLSFYGISDWISAFQCEHSINRIDVHLTSIQEIEDGLLNGKHDFAIVWHLDNLPYHLTAIPLKKIEFAALMPSSHPLAEKPSVQISDLNGEPLLLLNSVSVIYDRAIQFCQEAGFAPTIRATAHRGRSIEDLVIGGFGIGIMPVDAGTNFPSSVVRKPLLPRCEIALDIIYHSTEPSESASALMQYLCATASGDSNMLHR